jgi:lactate dehydrogenase-like 2-hydroxyacid dehydrogenase
VCYCCCSPPWLRSPSVPQWPTSALIGPEHKRNEWRGPHGTASGGDQLCGGQRVREINLDVLSDEAQVVFLQDQQPSEQLETLRSADALIGWRLGQELPPGQLAENSGLRLIQLLSAGVDNVDFTAIPPSILIADNAGAYARPMAEHVMAMILSLAKRLPRRHAALARGEFDQQALSLTLDGAVCAILGFGGIGTTTEALMRAFGAHPCSEHLRADRRARRSSARSPIWTKC